ncbi:MAG TPA: glycoside hydrolase family 2 TIM barrel-domain containing protein [Bacteroidales bacterium]|nr:glycoside hydrolase family 2 TIM barrel-domain containing protein [Bacteroidales bacterium]
MKRIISQVAYLVVIIAYLAGCNNGEKSQTEVFDRQLKEGWTIESSAKVNSPASEISKTGFNDSGWYKTTVPATVMAALIANGEYEDIFMGDNISKVDTSRFRTSWWYRNEFTLGKASSTQLIFEGINYRANIWLNGKIIASEDTLFGGFRIFKLNVSDFVKRGNNALAVEVFYPKPDEPSIGFVDWAPMSPDRLMGLWRPVKIRTSGTTSLDNVFVTSKIATREFKEADLNITAEAVNHTARELRAVVRGRIEAINFEKQITLAPYERKLVVINSTEFPQLKIINPRIWWTYDLGKPELYELNLEIENNSSVSYSGKTRFGIRKVEDYLNTEGHRGYKLNGKEVLIKGGGWVDGMFLNDTEEKVKAQFEYAKHANMNTIRLEGFWGNSERFYELADEMGLLIMCGWSCQWEWEGYLAKPEDDFMSIRTPEDIDLILKYTNDHIKWLRNHPSIYVWVMGSDKLPRPELEEKYYPLFKELDPTRPLLMSCKSQESSISGKTAVKMNGPYDYVSPNYWYIDKENGGAFGFNTETGPGPQVPSLEVVKSMIPEDKLWPVNEMWSFHCGRGAFKTLDRYIAAFNNRYGEQHNVEDFTFKSQASNLEAMRAMFEAFAINRSNTTGIIQWMYNSAWPKLIWQFWDYNLLPNASLYGAKLGARNINIAYNYGNNSVYVTNLTTDDITSMKADIKVYGFNGKIIGDKQETTSVKSNSSEKVYTLPSGLPYSKVYFLKLKLSDEQGNNVADNFYWLSTKPDVPDFKKTTWFYTPMAKYADFTDLNKLPKVKPVIESSIKNENDEYEVTVKLSNNSNNIAFLIELGIAGDKSGKSIAPILWDDNYVSLVPGESRVIKARFSASALKDEKPVFRYKGWNVE